MTPEERDLVTRFLDDLRGVPNGPRDAEASRLIEQNLSGRPDALYLLVQHALLADQAFHEAQRRIAALEAQASAATQPSRSFLGSSAAPSGTAGGSPEPPAQPTAQQGPGFFGGGVPAQPGGFSSFLRGAATTAAGVAGGEFLFEGLSNLFGAHQRGSFLGGGSDPSVENVTINEYDQPGMSAQDGDLASDDDLSDVDDTDDIESA